jgi:hypothetical protein
VLGLQREARTAGVGLAELLHFLAVIKNDDLFRQVVADAKRRATM